MSSILFFKSAGYLHFKFGEYPKLHIEEKDSKRILVIEPNEKIRNGYDVAIYRGEDGTFSEENLLISISKMRIMEKSKNRIVLQDWDEDEETCLPIAHHGIIINYKDNEVFNCILNYYDNGEDYIFLNESEIDEPFHPWTYDLYQPDKNGVFTERLMNNHSIKWTFENNQKHGIWKALTPKGAVSEQGYYKNGKPDGEYFSYGVKGHIRCTGNYIQGRRTGNWKYYNNDGIIQIEGNFFDDKEVGEWLFYNSNGELERTEDYGEKGKPLFFGRDLHGAGFIVCRGCGFKQKTISLLHDFPLDKVNRTLTKGYQCQLCGTFQTRISTPEKRDIDLTCECGGILSDKEPLFCPKCKSFDLEYHCTMMT